MSYGCEPDQRGNIAGFALFLRAPWLSWLQRPTVILRVEWYRKVVSSSLTGAVLFHVSQSP